MIERYSRPKMADIFSLQHKYELWQEIELLEAEACAKLGLGDITPDEAVWIREHAHFNTEEIDEIESVTNHDVIAFLTNLGSYVDALAKDGTHPSRHLHYGMTSTDLGDTALACQLSQACDVLIEDFVNLGEICKRRALEEQDTICVGRTHGIHAEPMTFGLKFGSWAFECKRDIDRLRRAKKEISVGEISGAVGTYSSLTPEVEAYICTHLGLSQDDISTQVISRDHHAYLAGVLATCAGTCERIATEIRNLQKTETLEAEEPFKKGQKGSSAMPHKRNPITAEKICGLSRVVKANAQVAFDNIALWHERDISHSSNERVALADSFIALDHMLCCLTRIVDGLVLYPERMRANVESTRGLIYSSKVLLALVDAGLSREAAYEVVQSNAMQVWEDIQLARSGENLKERLCNDKRVQLSRETLDHIFTPEPFLKNLNIHFDRIAKLHF